MKRFSINYLNNKNVVCFVFGLHSCGLCTGYSLVGWIGHGLNIILSMGSGRYLAVC